MSGNGPDLPDLTVYYDGSCPLCRTEISHYRRQEGAGAIDFVDVSRDGADCGAGLDREAAMARFHVRGRDGALVSGAAGFVRVWTALAGWRWAARLAAVPGVLWVLEGGYRLLLPVRRWLSSRLAARANRGAPARKAG